MKQVTNNTRLVLTLVGGTILSAAGTPGSTKPVAGFSETDDEAAAEKNLKLEEQLAKLAARGSISVREEGLKAVQSPKSKVPSPESSTQQTAPADQVKES